MAKTIFKYQIPAAKQFVLSLPLGAQILKVGAQGDNACLWALVTPGTTRNAGTGKRVDLEERKFRIYATGHAIEEADLAEMEYVDTFFPDGGTVWHLFEVK